MDIMSDAMNQNSIIETLVDKRKSLIINFGGEI